MRNRQAPHAKPRHSLHSYTAHGARRPWLLPQPQLQLLAGRHRCEALGLPDERDGASMGALLEPTQSGGAPQRQRDDRPR
jgi:hypothetical protein